MGENHRKSPQILNYYGDSKLLRRSIFSAAGSFLVFMGGVYRKSPQILNYYGDSKFVLLPLWKIKSTREVLHGVGADGVGVKFPIFAVNCCCLPLSFRRSREKRRKRGKMRRKRGKCVKKGENHSDPIYINPIKNLPKYG